MTEKLLQLRDDEVWHALRAIDPVAVLAEELIGRTIARAGQQHHSLGRLAPWPSDAASAQATDPVALEHPPGRVVCVASATDLRMAQAAALAALAARELLVPGGVTVAMLGLAGPIQPQLGLIARYVSDISHVALWGRSSEGVHQTELVDELELSGTRFSVASSAAEAVFGANLVIAAGEGSFQQDLDQLTREHLARGTVLINATGRDLPGRLIDEVDRVYVDDLGQLPAHADRAVAARHLAEHGGRRAPWIAGDLGQLLTGHATYRRRPDDVVLVELLGVDEIHAELVYRIYQAAQRRGLGTQIATNGE